MLVTEATSDDALVLKSATSPPPFIPLVNPTVPIASHDIQPPAETYGHERPSVRKGIQLPRLTSLALHSSDSSLQPRSPFRAGFTGGPISPTSLRGSAGAGPNRMGPSATHGRLSSYGGPKRDSVSVPIKPHPSSSAAPIPSQDQETSVPQGEISNENEPVDHPIPSLLTSHRPPPSSYQSRPSAIPQWNPLPCSVASPSGHDRILGPP